MSRSRFPARAKGPKNPASYGFSPQADAGTNIAALQGALDGGGLVIVDTPGVYDLNNTMFLDSDTLLICAPGVVFRKTAPYCNVLFTRGALTKEYNENITIDGVEKPVNSQEAPPTLVHGLRAQLGFFYVKGLTIRNFYPGTERNATSWGIGLSNCRIVGKNPQVLVNLMGNMKDVAINGCYLGNPLSTAINVDKDSANPELNACITGCTFAAEGAALPDPLPDHQECPLLRRDI